MWRRGATSVVGIAEVPFHSTLEVKYILPGVTGRIASASISAGPCASLGEEAWGEEACGTARASDGPNAALRYPRCRYTGRRSNLATAARDERPYSAPATRRAAFANRAACSGEAPGNSTLRMRMLSSSTR